MYWPKHFPPAGPGGEKRKHETGVVYITNGTDTWAVCRLSPSISTKISQPGLASWMARWPPACGRGALPRSAESALLDLLRLTDKDDLDREKARQREREKKSNRGIIPRFPDHQPIGSGGRPPPVARCHRPTFLSQQRSLPTAVRAPQPPPLPSASRGREQTRACMNNRRPENISLSRFILTGRGGGATSRQPSSLT